MIGTAQGYATMIYIALGLLEHEAQEQQVSLDTPPATSSSASSDNGSTSALFGAGVDASFCFLLLSSAMISFLSFSKRWGTHSLCRPRLYAAEGD